MHHGDCILSFVNQYNTMFRVTIYRPWHLLLGFGFLYFHNEVVEVEVTAVMECCLSAMYVGNGEQFVAAESNLILSWQPLAQEL